MTKALFLNISTSFPFSSMSCDSCCIYSHKIMLFWCFFPRLLHSERGEVPDVPAIYFCQPTEENLIRIGQDFNDGLYSSYYLNFISPISRQKMEDLALAALQAGCQASIKKVKKELKLSAWRKRRSWNWMHEEIQLYQVSQMHLHCFVYEGSVTIYQ